MARRSYSEETKAAVMAALLTGQSISEVAREYRIPAGTVKSWRAKLKDDDQPVATQKKEAVGALLVEYVRESLITLTEQAVAFRDPEWVKEQPAGDLAVLHGVLSDKTVRILEAMGSGGGDPGGGSPGGSDEVPRGSQRAIES